MQRFAKLLYQFDELYKKHKCQRITLWVCIKIKRSTASLFALFAFSAFSQVSAVVIFNGDLILNLTATDDGFLAKLTKGADVKLTGNIGIGRGRIENTLCKLGEEKCSFVANDGKAWDFQISLAGDNGFNFRWSTEMDNTKEFRDCFNLDKNNVNWYGGPEKYNQAWPIENNKYERRPLTTIKSDNSAVLDRYWLSSLGVFIWANDTNPLFLDQNNEQDDTLCLIAAVNNPYYNQQDVILEYKLMAESDPQKAHKYATEFYLGKPTGHPDEWIIQNPIWTTWAKYKKDINDEIVVAFAKDIADNGFTGQIEIDDYWETCYGSLVFNDKQFAQINDTVKQLKSLNFTVTLWTHPFVNSNCEDVTSFGLEHGYFVQSYDGSNETEWWDGKPAHHVDFTNELAAKWFIDRLELLRTQHGIDSFKFDAGESDYPPMHAVAQNGISWTPNTFTESYVRTCAQFGNLIEVRSAWRTQDLPIFVRMLDKDSKWGLDNGLHSLITTLLNFNMNGYVMVLPDMVGGNGYGEQPTAELLARWTQANTFMPTMQFSYLPWEITSEDFDGLAIIKKFVKLHAEYADEILTAMNNSIKDGTPVNPPIWWIDPTNKDALKVNDEYLLGENILVAPVIVQGATARDIVLPRGNWTDGNNGDLIEGPITLKDYPAPIDVLPYFLRKTSN